MKKNDNQLISLPPDSVCIQVCLVCPVANAGGVNKVPAVIRDATSGFTLICHTFPIRNDISV